jgi:indolepyruvate ferredoxin oxidoreductase
MLALPQQQLRDFLRRFADLLIYEDDTYADAYAGAVRSAYEHERSAMGPQAALYEATAAVIWNLAKVMAIKDEIWVAYLLTSDEKLEADRERYGIDPARGDRVRYLHINRPHFDIFGRSIEWDMATRNWMLRIVRHLRVLRRLLPRWHAREKAFRNWYSDAVIGGWLRGDFASEADALEALRLPMTCTGYRDVVYPKHERARARVAELLQRRAASSLD